jgi:hypothetical protein
MWGSHSDSVEENAASIIRAGKARGMAERMRLIRVYLLHKSRRMRRAGFVACTGKREVHTGIWWGDLREGDQLGDPDVDGRIILKLIFKTWDVVWIGLSWLRIGTGGGLL